MKHTCSWHDKLVILWTLNRQVKIFLRDSDCVPLYKSYIQTQYFLELCEIYVYIEGKIKQPLLPPNLLEKKCTFA